LRPIRDASAFSAAIHEDDGSAEKVTFGGRHAPALYLLDWQH